MEKENILVSACFLKDGYKYDGTNNFNLEIKKLEEKYNLILVCPEVFGGLSTPRIASEQKGNKVYMKNGNDVTNNFVNGAIKSKDLAIKYNVKKAILKAKSPSCGYGKIYDGTFTHTLIDGNGVLINYLLELGIKIYTEENFLESEDF